MDIIKSNLVFKTLPKKRKRTRGIVLHHTASLKATPEWVHEIHLKRHWLGAGYHYLVRLDGTCHILRADDAIGAHCGVNAPYGKSGYNNNRETVGIAFEGYFHYRAQGVYHDKMEFRQLLAGQELIKHLLKKYPDITFIKAHKEMPLCRTACPGDYFPMDKFKKVLDYDLVKDDVKTDVNRADGDATDNTEDDIMELRTIIDRAICVLNEAARIK